MKQMTTEIGTLSSGATLDDADAARRALIDAFRKGEVGTPLLRTLLGTARLPAEQQAFVELLIETEEKKSTTSGDSEGAVIGAGDAPIEPEALAALQQELTDLREANDTIASALGACPYCWGGDRQCEVCRGHGRAGYTEPDPELFNELVMPAIQRAQAIRRAGSRPQSGRTRS
ncbi:MAG: hypothetical protein ABJD07_00560 [Gemmatimonadaceae bacterium]